MEKILPDYKKIYQDIIVKKYPYKRNKCETILKKENLSVWDIINLNDILFGIGNRETCIFNQKHRSYSKPDILEILDYQQKNSLNNTQLANRFKLSRNTIAKWRKIYLLSN